MWVTVARDERSVIPSPQSDSIIDVDNVKDNSMPIADWLRYFTAFSIKNGMVEFWKVKMNNYITLG